MHLFQLTKLQDLVNMGEIPADVLSEVEDDQMENLKYVVNSHFTNQDSNYVDFINFTRVFLYTGSKTVEQAVDSLTLGP